MSNNTLRKFFEPKSIMIIGASKSPGKAGNVIVENILANGFEGKVYPVNPGADEILGTKCYHSIADVPEVPDLAVMAVPNNAAADAVIQCANRGVKAMVMTNSGFAEVDKSGAELQNKIVQIAQNANMRIMGPNTSGITSTPARFCASIFPLGQIKKGRISCISQTGNFATHTMRWMLTGENFGICRVAGLGNRIDVDEAELLEYFGEDTETGAILLYIEGFKNGRRFLEIARNVSKRKPIIAIKSGRTAVGTRAMASHTASMAGNDVIIDNLFKQAGVVRIEKYSSLIDTAKFLSMQSIPQNNRVAILTPSGAMGIIAADACERLGLKVADLSKRSYEKLAEIFPSYVNVGNPIDIWGATFAHGVYGAYEIGTRIALEDDGVDIVLSIINLSPETATGKHELDVNKLAFYPELSKQYPDKPVIVVISGDKNYYEAAKKYLEERSIPVFLPVEPGLEAVANAYYCRRYMNRNGA